MVASHTVKLVQALEGDAAAIRKLTREPTQSGCQSSAASPSR